MKTILFFKSQINNFLLLPLEVAMVAALNVAKYQHQYRQLLDDVLNWRRRAVENVCGRHHV